MRLDAEGAWAVFLAMDQDPRKPAKPAPKNPREFRLEREAAALRANLRKRKEQARAREDDREPPPEESHEA